MPMSIDQRKRAAFRAKQSAAADGLHTADKISNNMPVIIAEEACGMHASIYKYMSMLAMFSRKESGG